VVATILRLWVENPKRGTAGDLTGRKESKAVFLKKGNEGGVIEQAQLLFIGRRTKTKIYRGKTVKKPERELKIGDYVEKWGEMKGEKDSCQPESTKKAGVLTSKQGHWGQNVNGYRGYPRGGVLGGGKEK